MGTKKRKTKKVKTSEETFKGEISDTANAFRNVALAALLLLILVTPFFRGLFFPEDQVKVLLFSLILAVLTVLYVWSCRRDGTANLSFLSHPLDYFMLALPGVYLLSCFTAANPGLAVNELVENTLYFIIFWCSARLITTRQSFHRVLSVIYLAAIGLSLAGLATATGIIHIKDGYIAGRIYSSFQYPNALASYLGAAFLVGLYFIARLIENHKLKNNTSNIWYYGLGLMLAAGNYLLLLVFLGTGSRGGFLLLVLVLPLFILLNRSSLRIPLLAGALLAALGAVPGRVMFIRQVQAGEFTTAWQYVLLGLAAVMIIHLAMQFLLTRANRRYVWVGLAGFITMAVLGIGYFSNRLGLADAFARFDIFNKNILEIRSAVDRFEFMGTALAMIKERPIIGWGGGGWQEAYRAFQEYHFNSTQVHSYFFQVGVETGILGLLVVFGIWALFFFSVYKLFKKGERDAAVLLGAIGVFVGGRAAIDFDLSLAALTIMLMTCFGAARGMGVPSEPVKKISAGRNNRQMVTAVLLIVVVLVGASMLASANASLQRSYVQLKLNNIPAALAEAEAAARKNPFDPGINLYLSGLRSAVGDSEGAERELREAVQKSPYSAPARAQLSDFLIKHKRYDEALAEARKAVELAPLQVVWYEKLARAAVIAALDKAEKGEIDGGERYTEIVLNLPQEMNEQYESLSEKHKRLWFGGPRINNPTPELRLRLGQAHGLRGNYSVALEQLKIAAQHIPGKKPGLKGEALFWQAAVLEKQGKKVEAEKVRAEAEKLWPEGKKMYEKLVKDLLP